MIQHPYWTIRLLQCLSTGNWQLIDTTWPWGDTLLLIQPGAAHAVHVMWRTEGREFVGWYINLQEPLRRTPISFDFMDQALDIVVEPGLSTWRWKDESEFQSAQKTGIISADQARAIRAEGEHVIERVRNRDVPFSDGWENWVPDAEWLIPTLPANWDKLPSNTQWGDCPNTREVKNDTR